MRRSTFALLIGSALLAACLTPPAPASPPPAAASASPTQTAPPPSIHIDLTEQCSGYGVNDELRYTIRFTDYEGPDVTLIDRTLEGSQELQRITMDSGPAFKNAVTFLTDGHNGWVAIEVMSDSGGCASRKSELSFLTQKPPGGSDRVDFAGYEVHAIELRLDEVDIESPGSDPNGDGLWTDFTLRGELVFYGSWPAMPTITPTRTPAPYATPTPTPTRDLAQESPTAPPSATPTAGPPFPGADYWLLRLPGMQFVYLDPMRDGGYLLTARAEPHRSDLTALFHLNARGEIMWQKQFSGYNTSGAFEVVDGGLVLVNTWGLTKFDADGGSEWYEPISYAEGSPVQSYYGVLQSTQTGSSGRTIVLSGPTSLLAQDGSLVEQRALFGSTPDGVQTRWQTSDASWSAGPIDYKGFFLQRLSASGASWLRRFDLTYTGSDVHSEGVSIIGTRDGGALFVALVPYLRGGLARYVAVWAVRLNSQGDILWQSALDGGEEGDALIMQTTDGGFVIATSSGYMVDEIRPLRLLRLNAYGAVLWDRFYRPDAGRVVPEAIIEGSDGSLVIAARALQGWSNDEVGDLLLLKTDRNGSVSGCPWLEQSPFDPPIRTSAATELENLPAASLESADIVTEKAISSTDEYDDADFTFGAICAFPAPPPPPTTTPLPTPAPAAAEPGHLYPFGTSNAHLLGASRDGEWLQPGEAARQAAAPIDFHLYGFGGFQGEITGLLREVGSMGTCLGIPGIEFTSPPPAGPDLIAVSGPWSPQPRTVLEIVPSAVYETVLTDYLREAGIRNPVAQIDSIYRFDIEGDGFQEVLISASRFTADDDTPGAVAGDYSVVLLRALVDGEVATLPLISETYPTANPSSDPVPHRIAGILDLNGDGAFDLVTIGEYDFGKEYRTFDLTQPAFGPVTRQSCMP
jgi:hypothetical protein